MYTKQQAVRAAKDILKKSHLYSLCLDALKKYDDFLSKNQFEELVEMLVSDTYYYEVVCTFQNQ